MHLIVCIDDRDGMAFCGRRLSRDREVITHIQAQTNGCRLWMHPQSAQLFADATVEADPDFLKSFLKVKNLLQSQKESARIFLNLRL